MASTSRRQRLSSIPHRKPFRLAVEALEDRLVPALDFLAAQTYASGGANPVSVAVADFNNDAAIDIAVASTDIFNSGHGALAVLLGDGQGGFGAPITLISGPPQFSVAVGD